MKAEVNMDSNLVIFPQWDDQALATLDVVFIQPLLSNGFKVSG
jgi:hypothetical protein